MPLWRDPVGVIHADNPIEGDRTLCGMAEEGPATGEDGDGELVEVSRARISCPACVTIITHCKGIPARKFKRSTPMLTRDDKDNESDRPCYCGSVCVLQTHNPPPRLLLGFYCTRQTAERKASKTG